MFGVQNDVFGGGAGEPAGATPFGSPPGGGVFGGDGGGEEQSSAWWESETGNDDDDDDDGQPDSRVESEHLPGGAAMGESKSEAPSVVNASELGFGGAQEEVSTTLEPQPGTSRPALAEARAESLGAPPADMFGPPPPPAAAPVAEAEPTAQPQTEPPLGQPPRPQAPPSRAAAGSAAPAPFSSQPQPPYGVKVDVGDAEAVGPAPGVNAAPSGSAMGVEVEPWADRTASPGWEKQPSPPLDLGVFGAPPEDSAAAVGGASELFGAASGTGGEPAQPEGSFAAVGVAADLFGAASGAAGESGEGEGDHGGWGMCSADPEGGPEAEMTEGTADADTGAAEADAAPVRAPPTRHLGKSGSLEQFSHLSHPPRSSFVANDGTATASVAALALGVVAPSSPPRLFASRSSSWTEKDTTATEEKVDYEGMFTGTDGKASGDGVPPREGAAEQQGREGTGETNNPAAGAPTCSRNLSPGFNLPPPGSNTNSEKYSQGAQPQFSTIPEALDSQSPPRLRGRPHDHPHEEGSAMEVASSSSHARDGSASIAGGPAAATPESGGRVGPGSTLSTPFGALSRGSGTTPRVAEGFPSSEDGGVFDGQPAEGSVSDGKDAPGSAELSAGSRGSYTTMPVSVVAPAVSAEGGDGGGHVAVGAAVEEADGGEAPGVASQPQIVEGKEDGQPRWDAAPHAAKAAGSPPPSAVGEAARKMDADSAPDGGEGVGDGWSDDDWGVDDDDDDDADAVGEVCDPSGDKGGKEAAEGAAVAGAPESGGESETNLFGSEASDGDDSWGEGREEVDGGDRSEAEREERAEREESGSESEADLGSFSDNDLSNEASIAETTASDFFAVRQDSF